MQSTESNKYRVRRHPSTTLTVSRSVRRFCIPTLRAGDPLELLTFAFFQGHPSGSCSRGADRNTAPVRKPESCCHRTEHTHPRDPATAATRPILENLQGLSK